jgi:hypothetical protein
MTRLLHDDRRYLLIGCILSLLGLLLLMAFAAAPRSVVSFASSPQSTGTPNPACGVAGVWDRSVLEVLNLS